jgi:hypothetical protein
MAAEQNALTGLQEIALPTPVPYVPHTIGWLVVALLLLALIGWIAWRARQRWLANAYRREAAAELASISSALRANRPEAIASLPELLKRTAIAATSRDKVAALTGPEWLAFLDRTLGGDAFTRGAGPWLTRIAYADRAQCTQIPGPDREELLKLARRWIEHHHADV